MAVEQLIDEESIEAAEGSQTAAFPEPVWTYRGYQLKASEFTTAMVHMFRAEIHRSNVWRQRLDVTTNWAVITTGAALSFAFSSSNANHSVILLNILLVTMFLIIEGRRYRYYELWSYRVRLMETDFFAAMLVPPFQPSPDWSETLAEHLLHPRFPISMWEAIGRRFRRNYLPIYLVLALAWVFNVAAHPVPVASWEEFYRHASIGGIPGQGVVVGGMLFYALLLIMDVATRSMQAASGEVLPRYTNGSSDKKRSDPGAVPGSGRFAWFRPSHRREQMLTLVITKSCETVAADIMKQMRRGVTRLEGTGMYSGQARSILMCALTVTEIPHLKSIVRSHDPESFVIVSPAKEVFGQGFVPLG